MLSMYRKVFALLSTVALLGMAPMIEASPTKKSTTTSTSTYKTSSSSTSTYKTSSSSTSTQKSSSTSTSTHQSSSSKSSSAATSTPTSGMISVDYNFETVMNGDPIAATNEIGVYNLLFFSMNLVTLGANGVNPAGILLHSVPNAAAFSANTMIVDGTPIISVNYEESQISSFDPHTFYYGCVAATEVTTAGVPVTCTIDVVAVDANSKVIATQAFNFVSNGGLLQNQMLGTFTSAFKNVYTLQFNVTSPLTTAALIDSFEATLHEM